jgi:hypothetical protein
MKRIYMTAAAVLAWCGLALQLGILLFNAATGRSELSELQAVWRFLGYFTILTNIVVAVSYTSRRPRPRAASSRGPWSTRGCWRRSRWWARSTC